MTKDGETKGKYFRMLARAVPSGWIVRGNDAMEEDCFTQFSASELKGLNIVGMGVKLHHKGADVLGRVVDKIISEDDGLLVQIEIPMMDDTSTVHGEALSKAKQNIVHMVEQGYLKDISLAHYNKYTPHPAEDGTLSHILVEKKPMEVSLTPQGYREGSEILLHNWDDKPFLEDSQYPEFSPDNSTCKSVIDWIPEDFPQIVRASIEDFIKTNKVAKKDTPKESETNTMAANKLTQEEINAILKRSAELDAEVKKMKPVFERAVTEEENKQKSAKEQLQRSTNEIFDATMEIMKKLESEAGKSDTDKALYEEKIRDLTARKEKVEPMMNEMLNASGTDPSFGQTMEQMQNLLANLAPTIMTCARFASGTLERVEKEKQDLLKLHQNSNNAGGASNISSTDAGSSLGKRPIFVSMDEYDAILAKKCNVYKDA